MTLCQSMLWQIGELLFFPAIQEKKKRDAPQNSFLRGAISQLSKYEMAP